MKAQIIRKFGDPSVFELTEVPMPVLKPGHVILKVKATSVNQIDCKIRQGLVPQLAPEFPAILHGDVAGIVDQVAADVTDFKIGDEVYGCAGGVKGTNGALSEFMLADSQLLAKKPKALSMTAAAAIPLVSITAWEGLFFKFQLKSERNILVHGGVGGVGHIVTQLAKCLGLMVVATVTKQDDFTIAKSYQADEVINAKEESVANYVNRLTNGTGFDIVFDTVGGQNLNQSFLAARPNGKVVATAARSTHDLTPLHNKGLSLHLIFMLLPLILNQDRKRHGLILKNLTELVDAGKIQPRIDSNIFPFEQVSAAHAYVESGQARGKVVIQL